MHFHHAFPLAQKFFDIHESPLNMCISAFINSRKFLDIYLFKYCLWDTLYILSFCSFYQILINPLQLSSMSLSFSYFPTLFLSASLWIISSKLSSSVLIVSPALTNLLLHFLNFVFHFDLASFIEVLFFISARTAFYSFLYYLLKLVSN